MNLHVIISHTPTKTSNNKSHCVVMTFKTILIRLDNFMMIWMGEIQVWNHMAEPNMPKGAETPILYIVKYVS